jgi:translation initiation factor 3 subunit D
MWTIKGKKVIVRTEFEAVKEGDGPNRRQKLRALFEYNARLTGDYRKKLDTFRGQILGNECKNNMCKLSRWSLESKFAGAESLSIGFASRKSQKLKEEVELLGVHTIRIQELNTNLTLNYNTCWGVFFEVVRQLEEEANGTFILVRDPNRPVVRLYRIPHPEAFDQEVTFA